ncbi:ABC transporter substrate-binding protein [Metallumcola ferriviriculae]|uniref:ABC transporter substrate-binding protein n=1 Tax=Metallumcola ferriviriculae TaxID=3039180 RepID=A0AAU0UKX7_9FIRM|nr:ABC transporter substrate-binding protein [Desulfitibacteraceae bacterium MK1]
MVKRYGILLLIMLTLVFVVAGCGSKEGAGDKQGTDNTQDQADKTDGTKEVETETLVLGLATTLSGTAADWGNGQVWAAEEAANQVNEHGGIELDGKKYLFDVVAYDNKYTAAEGSKVAQTLVRKDKVNYIVGTVGSAPTLAVQSITEPAKILMLSTAWSSEAKGTGKPYTFTSLNTPLEVCEPMYGWIAKQYPDAKSVAMLNANDATGKDTAKVAKDVWTNLGIEVLVDEYYSRGTTEFSAIVTKIIAANPDIIDLGATPPGDAGLIFKGLKEQGWDGVKLVTAGTSVANLVDAAPEAVEGVYLGLSPDFTSDKASPVQRELEKKYNQETGGHLNAISVSSYDAVQALVEAIKQANSIKSEDLLKVLPNITFESSYGPSGFGGAEQYEIPQQMLLPITITEIQNGVGVEVSRVLPKELEEKLK